MFDLELRYWKWSQHNNSESRFFHIISRAMLLLFEIFWDEMKPALSIFWVLHTRKINTPMLLSIYSKGIKKEEATKEMHFKSDLGLLFLFLVGHRIVG